MSGPATTFTFDEARFVAFGLELVANKRQEYVTYLEDEHRVLEAVIDDMQSQHAIVSEVFQNLFMTEVPNTDAGRTLMRCMLTDIMAVLEQHESNIAELEDVRDNLWTEIIVARWALEKTRECHLLFQQWTVLEHFGWEVACTIWVPESADEVAEHEPMDDYEMSLAGSDDSEDDSTPSW